MYYGTAQFELDTGVRCTRELKHTFCVRTTRTTRFFVDLHANGNPLRVTCERTVHEDESLGKRYTPTSTSKTWVTRVHASKKGDTQVRLPLSISALWYLRGSNHHSIGLSTR